MQERNYPKVFDIQDVSMETNLDELVEIPNKNHIVDASKMIKEFTPGPPDPASERVIYLNFKQKNARTNI